MKTIKELESEGWDSSFIFGYNDCKKDILKLIDEWRKEFEWDKIEDETGSWSPGQCQFKIDTLKQRIEGK